jgi:hypothetical protein
MVGRIILSIYTLSFIIILLRTIIHKRNLNALGKIIQSLIDYQDISPLLDGCGWIASNLLDLVKLDLPSV